MENEHILDTQIDSAFDQHYCEKCGGTNNDDGIYITHSNDCPDGPKGKRAKAEGVVVRMEELPEDLRQALSEVIDEEE